MLRREALDRFGTRFAICNPLHGAIALFNEDMAAALCAAVNDWVAKELLDREPRLRASILVPLHDPQRAVAEIERVAADRRFVQVLLLGDGRPDARRAGSTGRSMRRPRSSGCRSASMPAAPISARRRPSGWPSYQVEDYVAQSSAFENQLVSFLTEGVFQQVPEAQAGADRIRLHLAAAAAVAHRQAVARRAAGSAVDRPAAGRDHPRACAATLQPVDAPASDPKLLARTLEQIGSDRMLLFSTDYPHWQFDGDDVLPDGLPDGHYAQDPDRQSARDLSAFARSGAKSAIMRATRRRCDEHHRARKDRQPSGSPSWTATSTRRSARRRELHPFLAGALARAHDDLRRACAPRADRAAALSAHDGGRHARRCVSRAGAAGQRSRR